MTAVNQKTNSMLKLALVFFLTLLSFAVGTYVGKKYSDNQHKLANLEPNKKEAHESTTTHEVAGHEEGSTAHGKNEAESAGLTDNEVAKMAEEFATETPNEKSDEKTIPIAEVDQKDIHSISSNEKSNHKTSKTTKTLTQAAAEQVEKIQTLQPREPSSIKPQQQMKPAQFTVQIASFQTEEEAKKLTGDLLSKGHKTSFVQAQVNGQTRYRVHVGLFGTSKEANDFKTEFLEKTKMSSAFVQKIQ